MNVLTNEKFTNLIHLNFEKCHETKLLFKENHKFLNDKYELLCKKCLLNLHKILKQDPELMKRYDEVFKEQKASGIIGEAEETATPGENYYMPYHPVIRDDHAKTKLRIVFDISAKSQGPILNNYLYKGPELTPDL